MSYFHSTSYDFVKECNNRPQRGRAIQDIELPIGAFSLRIGYSTEKLNIMKDFGNKLGCIHGTISKPKLGKCKLNTFSRISKKIGIGGGIIRDHGGNFIVAFWVRFVNCGKDTAELNTVIKGVEMGEKLCLDLEIETESKAIIGATRGEGNSPSQIYQCRRANGSTWDIRLGFTQQNLVARSIANLNLSQDRTFTKYMHLPEKTKKLYILDRMQMPGFQKGEDDVE
ncbi:hypothetical protein CASFOL_036904 [Castilleja foliolosa]|uniref:RNase H type-1 domain-containing protein n=1 Tax=Castilleja foliolosa TaxID=1961234 RepID=A0ABD3BPX6_9LAMI